MKILMNTKDANVTKLLDIGQVDISKIKGRLYISFTDAMGQLRIFAYKHSFARAKDIVELPYIDTTSDLWTEVNSFDSKETLSPGEEFIRNIKELQRTYGKLCVPVGPATIADALVRMALQNDVDGLDKLDAFNSSSLKIAYLEIENLTKNDKYKSTTMLI